jgi:chemotaxis protein CheX
MNVAFVNPFITSTIKTFKTMLGVDVAPGKPLIKTDLQPTYDVSGIIGLSGEAQGAIALSFSESTALKVVSGMLGIELTTIGMEVTDGIGELANIIAGFAKQDFRDFSLSISLPNVIVGRNHRITSPSGSPTIMVPFNGSIGLFCMEVSLKTK